MLKALIFWPLAAPVAMFIGLLYVFGSGADDFVLD